MRQIKNSKTDAPCIGFFVGPPEDGVAEVVKTFEAPRNESLGDFRYKNKTCFEHILES